MSGDSLSNDDDLIVDDGPIYSNVLNPHDEVQLSGDLDAALRFTHAQEGGNTKETDGPTPAKRENIRSSCMYSGTGGPRSDSRGMFACSGQLNNQPGARGEMATLPAGYQDWQYRQSDSLTSDLSIDAGLSVASLNPNLNQAAINGQPSITAMGWKNHKNETVSQPSEACAHPGPLTTNIHPTVQEEIPKPSPEEYRQYIKKLHMENLQHRQNTPPVQQSEWQPPSDPMTSSQEEKVAPEPSVTLETVIYHQELDENGECPLHHLSQVSEHSIMAQVIGCMQQCGVLNQCVNLPNKMQQTPLFLAVQAGSFTLTAWLVRNGADPNIQGALRQERDLFIYRSPIHLAAMMGDTGMNFMQSLLQSPKVTNLNEASIGDKLTPLHLALLSHRPGYCCKQMVLALIDAGADIDLVVQSNGKTPLILALESRDLSLVTNILDRLSPDRCRAVLLKQTRSGDTCLHIAAGLTHLHSEQKQRLLRLLVTRGANGNIPNNAKEYPRDFARKEWDNMRNLR